MQLLVRCNIYPDRSVISKSSRPEAKRSVSGYSLRARRISSDPRVTVTGLRARRISSDPRVRIFSLFSFGSGLIGILLRCVFKRYERYGKFGVCM